MEYIFYEQSGKLLVAQVMERKEHYVHAKCSGSSLKKIKIKDVLLEGNITQQASLAIMEQIESLANEVDIDLVWACAPESVFDFIFLAQEYFGTSASLPEQAAMWQKLQSNPIYFAKKGKGQFFKQPLEQIQVALLAVAKKEERLRQQAAWVEDLVHEKCPVEILAVRDVILRRQNANDMTYKAVQQAAEQLKQSIPQTLLHAGAFKNAFDLHRSIFLAEHYPSGVEVSLPPPMLDCANVPFNDTIEVFSIDDSYTTEIDDAFSVHAIGNDKYRIGVHIAAPALAVQRDDVADKLASARMSTMYTPGEKITMLPDKWVSCFSLDEGTIKPVVSIYTVFDATAEQVFGAIESKIERIRVARNLRHDTPEMQLTHDDLEGEREDYPQSKALKVLWQGALRLSAMRDAIRGRPENNNRADFSFVVERTENDLTGDEHVEINQRPRGSPVDKIVSEWMIFANVQWAIWLSELKVPALFRTQSNLGVRTSTHAQAHLAMGVPAYMWSTSPLRRYVDWFNQLQLLVAIEHGVTAPMLAPFKAREVDVLTRMSRFDEKYKAYAEQQGKMERFWCLKWVNQRLNEHGFLDATAIVVKEGVVRLKDIPLYIPCPTLPAEIALQASVTVRLKHIDEVNLTIDLSLMNLLDSEVLSD